MAGHVEPSADVEDAFARLTEHSTDPEGVAALRIAYETAALVDGLADIVVKLADRVRMLEHRLECPGREGV